MLVGALIITITSKCQTKHEHPNDSFWETLRVLPVTVTSIDKDTLYWHYDDSRTVRLGSFVIDPDTKGNPQPGKTYLVFYCETHKVAYVFTPWKKPANPP
jgi:hypothetical protein